MVQVVQESCPDESCPGWKWYVVIANRTGQAGGSGSDSTVIRQSRHAQPREGNGSPGGHTVSSLTGSPSWVHSNTKVSRSHPGVPVLIVPSPTVPWQWSLSQRLPPLSRLAGFSSQQVSLRPFHPLGFSRLGASTEQALSQWWLLSGSSWPPSRIILRKGPEGDESSGGRTLHSSQFF